MTGMSEFSGKERDAETNLHFFEARYYSGAQGRFTSPDAPFADQYPSNPQSWNLYGYGRNNPLTNVDPSGLDCVTTSNQSSSSVVVSVERGGSADSCGGSFVDGTVDVGSLSYKGSTLTWSDNSSLGGGAMTFASNSGPSAGDQLSSYGQAFVNQPVWAPTGTVVNALGWATLGVTGGAAVAGAVTGGAGLTTLAIPAGTLPPLASNPTLQKIANWLFQATDVLPGGTAGAVRYERLTGELMSPSGHSQKAEEVINSLTGLLKSGKLSMNDQLVAREIIRDLSSALQTQPRK